MGLMRFLVAPTNRLSAEAAARAYLVGSEQIPWVSRVQLQNGVLSLGRNESDSGCLCCPYPVEGRGEVSLVTGTLVERFAPYHLTVELARGKVNQLRRRSSSGKRWACAKEHHLAALHQAMGHLSRAVTSQHDPVVAAEHAELRDQPAPWTFRIGWWPVTSKKWWPRGIAPDRNCRRCWGAI